MFLCMQTGTILNAYIKVFFNVFSIFTLFSCDPWGYVLATALGHLVVA